MRQAILRSNRAKYLVIDTETTGLSPYKHGLIQLAALALDREMQVLDKYCQYVKPPSDKEIDEQAMQINGISQAQIESGMDYHDLCQDFIRFVKRNFSAKPIMVGQFFPFDYGFVDQVFNETLGKSDMLKSSEGDQYGIFQEILGRNFIDTKSLANILNLKAELESKPPVFHETSLSKFRGLKDTLQIPQDKYKPHDALDDCYATREVLEKMMDLFRLV